ncbi:MAG: type II secretion system protein [Planctomycetota bacterium]
MGVRIPRSSSRGFTLIELLTVLLIIAILLAVAVPFMLRSRIAANEAAAIGAVRVLQGAEEQFRVENKRYGTVPEMGATDLLTGDMASGNKTGYVFTAFVDPSNWTAVFYAEGVPEVYNRTGISSYYVDESGVIRSRDTGGNALAPRADAETWTEVGD